jgi:hypothetical protein
MFQTVIHIGKPIGVVDELSGRSGWSSQWRILDSGHGSSFGFAQLPLKARPIAPGIRLRFAALTPR